MIETIIGCACVILIGIVYLAKEIKDLKARPAPTAQETARAILTEPVPMLSLPVKTTPKIWVGITAYEGEDPALAKEVRNKLVAGQVFGRVQWTDGPNVRWDQEIK